MTLIQALGALKNQRVALMSPGYGTKDFIDLNDKAARHILDFAKMAGINWAQPKPEPEWQPSAPFLPGGEYDWLPELELDGDEDFGTFDPIYLGRWGGDTIEDLYIHDRAVVFDSAQASWEEWGPKWGIRGYNVQGIIENVTQYRVGDFVMGREGHAIYCNMLGHMTIRDCHAIQCGGQAIQIVNRPHETQMMSGQVSSFRINIDGGSAIDCGAIRDGAAVRASWPVAIYNPGQDIFIEDFTVKTKLEPHGPQEYRSHGALIIGYGQTKRRTKKAVVRNLVAECWNSDREIVRLEGIDDCLLIEPDIDPSLSTFPDVVIVDDCKRVEIKNPTYDVHVSIKPAAKRYGQSIGSHVVKAGTDWVFEGGAS